MTIWIDQPVWPAHGRLWSHLISDVSYEEMHTFAAAQGIPERACEGDHYDVPDDRYSALVAAGAHPTSTRDLLARLQGSGLRLRKRKGERGIARVMGVEFADGSMVNVDLVRSSQVAPDRQVFAAMVLLQDSSGRYAVVYSPRREEWGAPGGFREVGESIAETVVREVLEETGLHVGPDGLVPCGYERFEVLKPGRWPDEGGVLQVFRARLDVHGPPLRSAEPDAVGPQWVTVAEFRSLCSERFWWPLVSTVIGADRGD